MKQIQGIAAARGFAYGPVFQFHHVDLRVEKYIIPDPDLELTRFEQAVLTAIKQIQEVYQTAKAQMSDDQAAIFEAHQMMLQDPELLRTIRKTITEQKLCAEFAVEEATEHYAQLLEGMEDDYFKSRASDIRDISGRLTRILFGASEADTSMLTKPSIIIARDLTPSDTILFDKSKVLGFCTVEGGETSHTAILARSLNIPAVVGGTLEILNIPNGKEIIVDGSSGEVFIDPTYEVIKAYKVKQTNYAGLLEKAKTSCQEPAVTLDGFRVEVVANIGNLDDAVKAIDHGAEGVGLLRTEFLYMERKTLPDEEEQYQAYSAILKLFDKLPVVLRTSDIGGDKELPYLDLPKELNPFLGVRGLRLALAYPEEILKPQLKASIRAGKDHNLRIMFPMVALLSEIRQVREVLETCKMELINEGISVTENIQIGIMVEVPAAALMADILAPEVDFFSIGTNDLAQYTMAADRTNTKLSYLSSAFSPAVLRMIQNVILHAHNNRKWIGLCGELAGEPLAIPILLGLGLDELSMNPQAIPMVKQIIRTLNLSDCQKLADKVLKLESAEEVKSYVHEKMPGVLK